MLNWSSLRDADCVSEAPLASCSQRPSSGPSHEISAEYRPCFHTAGRGDRSHGVGDWAPGLARIDLIEGKGRLPCVFGLQRGFDLGFGASDSPWPCMRFGAARHCLSNIGGRTLADCWSAVLLLRFPNAGAYCPHAANGWRFEPGHIVPDTVGRRVVLDRHWRARSL